MTFKAMFVVPLAQFQKVDLWVEGKDAVEFDKNLTSLNDKLKARLGVFMAELESNLKVAHKAALNGGSTEALEGLLKAELGAKVVSVQEPGTAPAEAPSEPSWEKPMETKSKSWENSSSVDLADLFK